MTFSCIVVDDDLFAVEQLEEYILKIHFLKLLKSYTNPLDALKDIQALNVPVDFLFTDIEMPQLSGLVLAETVNAHVKNIVLVSGYQEYAVHGYSVHAKDFLPKPFNFNKFEQVVKRLVENYKEQNPFIWLELSKRSTEKIFINEIIAVEGNGNYINVHTVNKMLIAYYRLSTIEKELETYNQFKRVNKSFIISLHHLTKRDGNSLILSNDLKVTMSESFRNDFKLD